MSFVGILGFEISHEQVCERIMQEVKVAMEEEEDED